MTVVGIHFDHPWLIVGVLLGPLVHALRWHARKQTRRVLESFATASARQALLVSPPRYPIWRAFLADVAWLLTLLAAAGPRWGLEEELELVRGRDIVLLLDMSQSMRAADVPPTRFDRARQATVDLIDDLRSRPGFRVAVVAFAADAALVCPLTEDLDYLRFRLGNLSLDDPPPGIRPRTNARSGTSFAAALRGLLSAHDPQARGFQDAILLSDGDDPGGLAGFLDALAEVEQAGVAVYTLGIGDPQSGANIRVAGRDEPVPTRLNEYPLEEIARRTGGVYSAARLSRPDVRGIFRRFIESKERTILPGRIPPQPKSQAAWLYGLALLLLGASAALAVRWPQIVADLAEGWKRLRSWTHRLNLQNLVRLGCWLLIALALLTAAEPQRRDDWEQHADQAMLEGRFAEAAELYRRAAERTIHPERVAYKAGLAWFQIGQYREAERQFRAAAASTSGKSRANALYNLGTTLLHRSGGTERALIEEAILHFEAALSQMPNDVPEDVRVNLELAKLLRLQTMESDPHRSPDRDRSVSNRSVQRTRRVVEANPGRAEEGPRGDDTQRVETSTSRGGGTSDRSDEEPMPGATRGTPLTRAEMVQPLSPEEAWLQVRQAMERIARQRRALNAPRTEEARNYPDW